MTVLTIHLRMDMNLSEYQWLRRRNVESVAGLTAAIPRVFKVSFYALSVLMLTAFRSMDADTGL